MIKKLKINNITYNMVNGWVGCNPNSVMGNLTNNREMGVDHK